jgi:predicted transcriptional regulator YheO
MTARKKNFAEVEPILKSIATGVARQFGKNCEVAVHNLTDNMQETVSYIENGHVTGRSVGDGASETVLEALRHQGIEDRYGYVTNSKDGKLLKSTTINIHGEDGDVIAVFCINYDIGDFTLARKSLSEFLAVKTEPKSPETITDNVNDLLEQLLDESHRSIGKPISAMTKEEKRDAVRYLERKGALLIKKSSERITEYYGISKYTLYNYLGEANACQEVE